MTPPKARKGSLAARTQRAFLLMPFNLKRGLKMLNSKKTKYVLHMLKIIEGESVLIADSINPPNEIIDLCPEITFQGANAIRFKNVPPEMQSDSEVMAILFEQVEMFRKDRKNEHHWIVILSDRMSAIMENSTLMIPKLAHKT